MFPSLQDFKLENRIETLKPVKLGQHEFFVNRALGYYPWFSIELRQRVKYQKAVNAIVTGEGGVSKSYTTSDICRTLAPKNFDVDDIVFRYPEFLRTILTSRRGCPVEFDEPSYAMSKKDWYKEICKALVKTIESFRFMGKPLFVPIINKNLLEKDIRSYLLQFHIVMKDRGKGAVYRIYPSQFKDKVYSYEICNLRYGLFDNNICARSCLKSQKKSNYCLKLNPKDKSKRCPVFRARYERKKISTQTERYEIALEESEKDEREKLTLDEIQAKALNHFDLFYNVDKDKIDVELMAIVVKRKVLGFELGHNKSNRLAKQIRFDHPELFNEAPAIHKDNVEKVL
jgi:hypothetical protein